MNRRQARKIGKRQKQRKNALKRQRGNPTLGPRQKPRRSLYDFQGSLGKLEKLPCS